VRILYCRRPRRAAGRQRQLVRSIPFAPRSEATCGGTTSSLVAAPPSPHPGDRHSHRSVVDLGQRAERRMTTTDIPALDGARLEAFVGQAVADMGAAISGLLLHLGDRLG